MVQFVTRLLIVSLLTLNIAWAVDECALTEPVQAKGVLLQIEDLSPDSPSIDLDCDDWCYVWLSPIVVTRNIILDIYMSATISGNSYTPSYSSHPIPPPFHPPIA